MIQKLILCIFLLAEPFEPVQKTDLEEVGLHGPVKEIVDTYTNIVGTAGAWTEGSSATTRVRTYDRKGNLVSSKIYEKNSLADQWIHTFDEQGRRVETVHMLADGTWLMKQSFRYDEQDRLAEKTQMPNPVASNSNPGLSSPVWIRHVYQYGDDGKLAEDISYAQDGTIRSKLTYAYSRDKHRVECREYKWLMVEQKWKNEDKIIYEYDKRGNLLRLEELELDGSDGYRECYKYDEECREIEAAFYERDTLGILKWLPKGPWSFKCWDLKSEEKRSYQDDGRQVEIVFINNEEGEELKEVEEYEFDQFGNWIEKRNYRCETMSGKVILVPRPIRRRSITYYNQDSD